MQKKLVLTLLSTLSLIGCANNPFSSYKNASDERLSKIYAGNIESAMLAESTSDVLFNMEYGSLLRIRQNYESSNFYFDRAQNSINTWVYSWTNTTGGQITKTASSMLINDNVNDYEPRGYEKTFLTTLHALNQVDLNNLNNARVEIQRMYQVEQSIQNYNQYMYNQAQIEAQKQSKDKTESYLYQQITQKYNFKDINSPQVLALKNSYQNAFSHYLAGFIFEALNEPSLARPGYVKAGQLNPTNTLIQQSINNIDKNVRPKTGYTDLLIVEEVGHAPQIKSNQINVPINLNLIGTQNSCINMINVFYPTMVIDKNNLASYNYSIDNKETSPLPMTDVNLMVAKSISDETSHIISRNIAAAIRNIATAQASCAAGGGMGALLNLGTAIGSTFIDKADERNWNLLPSKVNINRATLAYGKHNITVTVNGINYSKEITLDKPYQIITFRIIGNQVFFNPQRSMLN